MKKAVLFDLGNTLARYYDLAEFPAILERGISNVADYLDGLGIPAIPRAELSERVRRENHESRDYQVRPLEERLARIFLLDAPFFDSELSETICRRFMKPIFAMGRLYDDALPALKELRSESYSIGIVSNTSWGSPASLWREEIGRLGLEKLVDAAVFCRDVGWRKPDARIFTSALQELGVSVDESVFVGDEPRWDVVGPNSIGMEAIVIDRQGRFRDEHPDAIHGLLELPDRLREERSVGGFLDGF